MKINDIHFIGCVATAITDHGTIIVYPTLQGSQLLPDSAKLLVKRLESLIAKSEEIRKPKHEEDETPDVHRNGRKRRRKRNVSKSKRRRRSRD